MTNTYEVMLLLKTKASKEEVEKLIAEIKTVFKSGKIIKDEDLGKKLLQYPVKKEKDAVYRLLVIEGDPQSAVELSGKLKRDESVLRYLITKVDKVKVKKKPLRKKE